MADLAALFAWLSQAIDGLPTPQAKITLNINGSVIDADVETASKALDTQGRLVKVKWRTTSHLRIERERENNQ